MKTLDLKTDQHPDPHRPKMLDPGSALTNADPPTLQGCQIRINQCGSANTAGLPTLGRIFWPAWRRNSAAEERIRTHNDFHFFEGIWVEKKNFVFVTGIRTILFELS
jgi:hypothetical protein